MSGKLEVVIRVDAGPVLYELRRVPCGKVNCKRCPHGPYWYMLIKLRGGGHATKYIGKRAPEGLDFPQQEADHV